MWPFATTQPPQSPQPPPPTAVDNKRKSADTDRIAASLAAHQARHSQSDANCERQKLPQPPLPWKFLTPLFWAPTFPFIRFSTKNWPQRQRNFALGIAIVLANLHGFWLISNPDLSEEALRD